MVKKKKILVLGAGVAGIRCVQDLTRMLDFNECEIVLVDKENFHVYRADLYEVATAFNRRITEKCLVDLSGTVATPIRDLIDVRRVDFLKDEVLDVDARRRRVSLRKNGWIKYDFLVVALGSETNYFGIQGLKENCFPLKNVRDALAINCHLDQFFQRLWKSGVKRDVHIVVGGGGATGVEVAGELIGFVRRICRKYEYPDRRVVVSVIEATDKLGGMNEKGSEVILHRLKKLGVRVLSGNFIKEVTDKFVVVREAAGAGRNFPYDILIWTGGVAVNRVVQNTLGSRVKGGAVAVDQFLRSVHDRKIFVAGDAAYFKMPDGGRLEMLAQAAYQEGGLIAENLARIFEGRRLLKFKPSMMHYVVPVGGKFGVWMTGGGWIFKGWWVWVVKRLIYLRYAMMVLPFGAAIKKWLHSRKIFAGND